jgi:peroxiredoxin
MTYRIALALFVVGTIGCAPKPAPAQAPASALEPTAASEGESRAAVAPRAPGYTTEPGVARTDLGKAPGGTVLQSDGTSVDVSSFYTESGAIIVFYRGHWCKQCRKQLEELQAEFDEFSKRGFGVFAISTDDPSDSAALRARLGLTYDLYSDTAGIATQAWGIYSREHDLARPAVFVIRPGGDIVYRYVSDTPSDRPKNDELLTIADEALSGD